MGIIYYLAQNNVWNVMVAVACGGDNDSHVHGIIKPMIKC